MKVFNWVSYGDVANSYNAEDINTMKDVAEQILTIISNFGEDTSKVRKFMRDNNDGVNTYTKAIGSMIRDQIGTHESFEYGTGFTKLVGVS